MEGCLCQTCNRPAVQSARRTARTFLCLPTPPMSQWQAVTVAPSTRSGSTVNTACIEATQTEGNGYVWVKLSLDALLCIPG